MPSPKHEGILQLFRNRLSLAVEILRDVLHLAVPEHTRIRKDDSDLSLSLPAEYRSDQVVVLEDAKGNVVQGIIVEIQLHKDPKKQFTWPAYQPLLRRHLRAPACLLVVTVDASIASWASTPIDTGQPGSPFQPLVLPPSALPRLTAIEKAKLHPELAVLSAFAHGKGKRGLEVGFAATVATLDLDDEHRMYYHDLILMALDDVARSALEELMANGRYEPQSEFLRKHYGHGFRDGRETGKAEGKAEGLLAILAARNVPVSDEAREQILACRDIPTLDGWIVRAVTAASMDEILQ